ncbi:MAG: hypothetical protein ACRDRZ_07755 [Pseudonocardiaceae bacterium]
MARLTRFTWSKISTGLEMLPPTLMVAMGHPWLGAGTLGAVLASAALQSRMQVRSAQERHQAILSYARDTVSMGGDPTTVIAALQGRAGDAEDDGVPPEPPPRGYEKDWGPPVSQLYRPPRV